MRNFDIFGHLKNVCVIKNGEVILEYTRERLTESVCSLKNNINKVSASIPAAVFRSVRRTA